MKRFLSFLCAISILIFSISCTQNVSASDSASGATSGSTNQFKAVTNSKGLKIILPNPLPEGTNYLNIRRYNDTKGIKDFTISIDLPCDEIIDPFVEPGCEYSYQAEFAKVVSERPEYLAKSKWSASVKAENGIGELKLDPNTEIIHNSDTGISTVTIPFDSTKFTNQDSSLKFSHAWLEYNGNNGGYRTDLTEKQIYWNKVAKQELANTNSAVLKSYSIWIRFEKNKNISYNTMAYNNGLKNMLKSYPETITIKK